MSETAASAKMHELPVVVSLAQAYWGVFKRPRRLLTVGALPATACVVIAGLTFLDLGSGIPDFLLAIFFFALYLVPACYAGLAWARCSLWDHKPSLLLVRPWSAAYVRAIGYYIILMPCVLSSQVIAIYVGLLLEDLFLGRGDLLLVSIKPEPVVIYLLTTVSVVLLARLFLALPSKQVERLASPVDAWKLGAGTGVRLGAAILLLLIFQVLFAALLFFCLAAVAGATLELTNSAFWDAYSARTKILLPLAIGIVVPVAVITTTILFVELTIIAFRHLTGWSEPKAAILERFD